MEVLFGIVFMGTEDALRLPSVCHCDLDF